MFEEEVRCSEDTGKLAGVASRSFSVIEHLRGAAMGRERGVGAKPWVESGPVSGGP